MEGYAESEEAIKQQLMQDEQGLSLYRAITRFLARTASCRATRFQRRAAEGRHSAPAA